MPSTRIKGNITIKEAKLIKAKAQGKSHVEAYREAYSPNAKPETARPKVYKILKKPNVQEALQEELARQGISIEKVVAPVTKALNDDNVEIQLKGHDRAMKILGANQPTTVNLNFNQIAEEQRKRYDD